MENMKEKYSSPVSELTELKVEDVITASNETPFESIEDEEE